MKAFSVGAVSYDKIIRVRELTMSTYASTLGVCSWSLQPKSAEELVEAIKGIGVKKVQLALGPVIEDEAAWSNIFQLLQVEGIEIVSAMYGPVGEDYSTLKTIKETGGLVLDENWEANKAMAEKVAALAEMNGIKVISFHAGFIPHDHNDPMFGKLCERITAVADIFKAHGCVTLFETGQETAVDLMNFLNYLDREDIGINFDPANMILYGKGDPIDALGKLISKVHQVHIKDANASKEPGAWGSEEKAGTGEVDWKAFLKVLVDNDYQGNHVIEREAGNSRIKDIVAAAELITGLLA